MSLAPGTTVTFNDAPLARFADSDPAAWFVAGFVGRSRGDAPIDVRGIDEFVAKCGPRETYSQLYDALDVFFHEGGSLAYVLPVYGPSPVKASGYVFDQAGSTNGDRSLLFTAKDYGDWANGLNVEAVYSASTVYFKVSHDDDGLLETSPVFASRGAAAAWQSSYVTPTVADSNELPRSQTINLAGGADDHSNAVEGGWNTALGLATRDYGAGMVSMPGRTTDTAHANLLAHAATNHRTALLDAVDTAVVADLLTDVNDVQDGDTDRAGGLFAPWVICPGITPGTTRTAPYSALQAGLIARNASLGLPAGQPAAGIFGVAQYVTGLSQAAWSETDRESLNEGGVNIGRVINGEVRTYANRTLVDPDARPGWVELSGSRVAAIIANAADQALEGHVHALIDGRGHEIAKANGDIAAICLPFFGDGSLYGETPGDAFYVDTGSTINTPTTIANHELNAKLELKTSPSAERVSLIISKQPIG
jgi:phage tail sheath protein FI